MFSIGCSNAANWENRPTVYTSKIDKLVLLGPSPLFPYAGRRNWDREREEKAPRAPIAGETDTLLQNLAPCCFCGHDIFSLDGDNKRGLRFFSELSREWNGKIIILAGSQLLLSHDIFERRRGENNFFPTFFQVVAEASASKFHAVGRGGGGGGCWQQKWRWRGGRAAKQVFLKNNLAELGYWQVYHFERTTGMNEQKNFEIDENLALQKQVCESLFLKKDFFKPRNS